MLQDLIYGHFDDSQANQDALRYSALTTLVAFVHIIFGILFLIMGVYPLVIYNVIIVIMYFWFSRNMSNLQVYNRVFFIYATEIIIHSTAATILIGWDYGFMYYLVSLIPIAFYITFSISSFKRNLLYPYITSAVIFIDYIAIRIITYRFTPIYNGFHRAFEIILCIINLMIAISVTFMFSALFAIEVNSMQLMMEAKQEKLVEGASYDPLTHFLNRRSMDEQLTNSHRNAIINDQPYSIIMCDIDYFKKFNDTYGHDCGDFVLQSISKIITKQVRAKDSVCRWGGEEFLLLITDKAEIAVEVAERIRSAIEEYEFYYEGQALHVTITLGVSSYYASSKIKTLIEIADKRLYKGKENGRNQVVSN